MHMKLGLWVASAALVALPSLAASPTTTYTYDDLGRLWIVTYGNGFQITYSYDAAGNRSQVVTAAGTSLPPVAGDDYVNANVNTATLANPLSNDTDPNGLTLSVASVGQSPGYPPSHGTAAKSQSGTNITYTPGSNYVGSDSFTYIITNGNTTSSATVYVTVSGCPYPPNPGADQITVKHGVAYKFDPRTNDTDPCSYPLKITKVGSPNQGGKVSFTSTQLTYTPPSGWNGTENFSYTVSDGHGQSADGSVTANDTGVNNAPVAVADTLTLPKRIIYPTSKNCSPTSYQPQGNISPMWNDTDADGDTLSIISLGKPSKGSVQNNGDGSVTYTYGTVVQNQSLQDSDQFTYQITDGYGGNSQSTVTVNINVELDSCG